MKTKTRKTCNQGHALTRDNRYKRVKNGVIYFECRECSINRAKAWNKQNSANQLRGNAGVA